MFLTEQTRGCLFVVGDEEVLMGRYFWVGCGCFSWGGGGARESARASTVESFLPRCPGQTREMFKIRQTVDQFHVLKTVKGMKHLVLCYMFSLGSSSGSSDSVRIYRRVIFGKKNWRCA